MIATGEFNYKYEDFGIDISTAKEDTTKTGKRSVSVICPRCSSGRKRENQRKSCLWINITDGMWKCHNCEWKGGLEFGEKGNKLFEKHFAAPVLKPETKLSNSHYEWLVSERCIDPDVIKQAKLYSDGNRVVFPFYREGRLVNYKKRTPSKTGFQMFEGAEQILYGLEFVKKPVKNTLVFVEGETDALAIRTAGFTAVSVPNGSNSNLDCIRDLEDQLPRKIILAGDSDEKGKKLTAELAHRIGKDKCWLLEWPDGIKDANEFLVQHGAKSLADILELAKPYPIAGIYDVESVEDEIWDYYNNGVIGGLKIGWKNLDPLYTVKEGFWTIVTGVPSSGKSGLLDHMAIKLAQTHGWKFGMCSPENQPVSLHYVHLIEKVVGKPFFKGPKERMTPQEAIEAMQWIKEHFFMILPDPKEDGSQVLKLDHILSDFKKTMFRHSTKGLIIDPMNELAHDMGKGEREDQYISKFITQLRQFARTNGVHIWLAVHPKQMDAESGQRHPVVRPNNLMGGSVWWAKADCILSVDRDLAPGTPSESDIHVQKIKPRYIGMTGVATLNYDGASGQYSNKD
jgi:twinkle protein